MRAAGGGEGVREGFLFRVAATGNTEAGETEEEERGCMEPFL